MCDNNCLDKILDAVFNKATDIFSDGFKKIILYGSYARGDCDDQSDIDIMIIADFPKAFEWDYRRQFAEFTSRLGLQFDVVISVVIKDSETFNKFADVVPFYQNVLREGISYAG